MQEFRCIDFPDLRRHYLNNVWKIRFGPEFKDWAPEFKDWAPEFKDWALAQFNCIVELRDLPGHPAGFKEWHLVFENDEDATAFLLKWAQ